VAWGLKKHRKQQTKIKSPCVEKSGKLLAPVNENNLFHRKEYGKKSDTGKTSRKERKWEISRAGAYDGEKTRRRIGKIAIELRRKEA